MVTLLTFLSITTHAEETPSQINECTASGCRCTVVFRGGRHDSRCDKNSPYVCYAIARFPDGSTRSYYGNSCTFTVGTCEQGYLSITPACAK